MNRNKLVVMLAASIALLACRADANNDLLVGKRFEVEHQFELQIDSIPIATLDMHNHLTFDQKVLFHCAGTSGLLSVCSAHFGKVNLTLIMTETPPDKPAPRETP